MSECVALDLDSPEHIQKFVRLFYQKILKDQQLRPIFVDVANINLDEHMQFICAYWEKLLLGASDYQRHTMNIHRDVHAQQAFSAENFKRWFALFCETADAHFVGANTQKAKRIAERIVRNMFVSLTDDPQILAL